jgi:protein-disulfide isomerase
MSKKSQQGAPVRPTGKRPNVVSSAKRGGPPKGFWYALGAVAIIGIAALSWQATHSGPKATAVDPALPALKAEGYVLGSPTAPVEVLEFADFECPGCGQFATLTEPDVRTRLVTTGKIRMRFMDFPLPMHKNTWDASLAASCANEQGKFWEMHDLIFQNQDRWNGEATSRPRGPLGDLAKRLGLDMKKYDGCMDAETHRAQITANQQEGERRQVTQTPTFIIGATKIPGALPFDTFNKLVEDALKTAAPTPAAPADTTKKTP